MAWGDSGIVLSSTQPEVDYVPKGAALIPWRLCTNFVDAGRILARFGDWPDSLLGPEKMESLYRGELEEPIRQLTVVDHEAIMPAFPYLDEAEAERISEVYETAKSDLYPEFGSFLEQVRTDTVSGPEGVFLPVQTVLVFALRERERQVGIWDKRTPEQKLGTVFALGTHVAAPFTRVSALIAGKGMRLSVPWGGAYGEYSKLLPILEDPYTAWVLRTADEDLQVMMAGLVSRPLMLLELIDTSRLFTSRGQARLSVDAIPASQVIRGLSALCSTMRAVAAGAAQCMDALLELWRSGRYSYLEGPGDYLEMTYAVLLGLLFSWALEDRVLDRPPDFVRSGENWVPRKPVWAAIARRRTRFPGVCVLREADSVWDSLLKIEKELSEEE